MIGNFTRSSAWSRRWCKHICLYLEPERIEFRFKLDCFLSQFTNTWLKQGGGMQCAGGWCSPPTVQSGFGDKWQNGKHQTLAVLQCCRADTMIAAVSPQLVT